MNNLGLWIQEMPVNGERFRLANTVTWGAVTIVCYFFGAE